MAAMTAVAFLHGAADVGLDAPTRTRVEGLCRAAVASVADPRNAKLEVPQPGSGPTLPSTVAPGPITPAIVNWYRSELPGRFVVVLDATRGGSPVQIRATVELKGAPCRLVSWRVSVVKVALTPAGAPVVKDAPTSASSPSS